MTALQDRIVWVTGAGSGIGRATAIAFAAAGARVALTGRREDALAGTAKEIGQATLVVPADLADAAAISTAHDRIAAEWGPVDILVNNAGLNTPKRYWHQLTPADLSHMVDVDLKACFLSSLAVLPDMRRRGAGTLIHVGSLAARMVFPPAGAGYAAAKAGVQQMSAYLNAEEGIHGIRSVCIDPGEVATEILDKRPVPPSPEDRAKMLQPEDVASLAVFIASLPQRATVSDVLIVPTDNQAFRRYAEAIANA